MKNETLAGILQKSWLFFVWIGIWIGGLFVDYKSLDLMGQAISVIVVSIVLLAMLIMIWRVEKDRYEMVALLLLMISVALRFLYCMRVGYHFSNHDLGARIKGSEALYSDGHIGYLQYIYLNNSLPDCDPRSLWCYYNPPFYYIVSAIFLKVNHLFGLEMGHMMENLQMLIMFFATLTIQAGYKILKEFGVKKKGLVGGVAVLAFHPYFIFGGATLNNDMLSILFIFAAILYTIRWYKDGKLLNIILIALSVGLGMMTKLSVGVIAIPIAMLFLVKFIKEKEYKRYFVQFVLFGILCVPLGMYWSVRNVVKYEMPLVYVQEISENSNQQLDTPTMKRINPLDFDNYDTPYLIFDTKMSYNVWNGLFKSAVFDEKNSGKSNSETLLLMSRVLLYSSMLLGILAVIVGIYNDLRKDRMDRWLTRFKYITYLVLIGSYVKFCLRYSVICSMNFRYVVPILAVAAINLGVFLDDEKINSWTKYLMMALIGVFSISTFVVYAIFGL